MPLELDPEEVAYHQQRAQEAREELQRIAPRGTTLFLQHHGTDPNIAPLSGRSRCMSSLKRGRGSM